MSIRAMGPSESDPPTDSRITPATSNSSTVSPTTRRTGPPASCRNARLIQTCRDSESLPRSGGPPQVRAQRLVPEDIHAEEGEPLAGLGLGDVSFHPREEAQGLANPREIAEDLIRNPTDLADLVACATLEGLHRRAEGAGGGFASQIDGDDDCHADTDAKDGHAGPERFPNHRSHDESVQQAPVAYDPIGGGRGGIPEARNGCHRGSSPPEALLAANGPRWSRSASRAARSAVRAEGGSGRSPRPPRLPRFHRIPTPEGAGALCPPATPALRRPR